MIKKANYSFSAALLGFILMAFPLSLFAQAESWSALNDESEIEVLLLGVWHFANPGLDEYNTEVDDYFAPHRQKEIDEVNQKLARFQPDKIFVERRASQQKRIDSLYREPKFNPREIKNKRGLSEVYQIGFKLGHLLGHEKLYCVDAPGLWLGSAVNQVAEEQYPVFNEKTDRDFLKLLEEEGQLLRKNTIRKGLLRFNTPEALAANHHYYITFAASIIDKTAEEDFPIFESATDDPAIKRLSVSPDRRYIGAELVAEWYRRNIKIYSKILEAVEAGDQRILVIFGQGHIPTLRQMFTDHPKFKIVEVAEYLKD